MSYQSHVANQCPTQAQAEVSEEYERLKHKNIVETDSCHDIKECATFV